jgi:hypothetical protein
MTRLLDRLGRLGWPRLLALAAACAALLSPQLRANRPHNQPPRETRNAREARNARPRLFRLLLTWLLLLVLLAVEFGISFLAMGRPARPLILLPAALMVATVGSAFMQVDRGPTIIRLFATAALLWLAILLGLGSLDSLTRTNYYVQAYSPQ